MSYQELREANIARNEDFLRSIGLMPTESKISSRPVDNKSENKRQQLRGKSKRVRNHSHIDTQIDESGLRRSSRIKQEPSMELHTFPSLDDLENSILRKKLRQGYTTDLPFEIIVDDDQNHNESINDNKKRLTLKSLREFLDVNNMNHSEQISDEVVELTVFRINGMSPKALGTRIKRIASAQGQHSFEKLLAFYYGLLAADLPSLAHSALAAFQAIGFSLD